MRCAAWIGRPRGDYDADPRCLNEGVHHEWSEDGTGNGVWISWCDFHFSLKGKT